MKKIFFNIVWLPSLFLVVSIFLPLVAKADGMGFNPYSDTWDFIVEKNQQALISYDKGVQKMALSIGSENSGKDFVWLFPIPAEAAKVKVEVFSYLPVFSGQNISDRAKLNLENIKLASLASQLYTIPYAYSVLQNNIHSSNGHFSDGFYGSASLGASGLPEPGQDVVVYQHVEKEGMISEVLSAKTANGLQQYFESKKLKLKTESLPVLNEYIGKDFSFIASWSQGASSGRGVCVSFPTKNIYFPLILTSVYGDVVVPAEIRIFSNVRPDVYKGIRPFVKTEYFDKASMDSGQFYLPNYRPTGISTEDALFVNNFLGVKNYNFSYTKVTINAPSYLFKKDLWFKNSPNFSYYLGFLFGGNGFVAWFVFAFICSIITAFLVGLIFFKPLRRKPLKLLWIALANIFSILGLLVAVMLINFKKDFPPSQIASNPDLKKYEKKRRRAFVFFAVWSILAIFLGLPVALLAVVVPLLLIFRGEDGGGSYFTSWFILASYIVLIILVYSFSFFKKYSKIKFEDKVLFKELKKEGYSTWTFWPRQFRVKALFLAVFSVSFILIVFAFSYILKMVL